MRRLWCICADSAEPPLLADAISTKVPRAGLYIYFNDGTRIVFVVIEPCTFVYVKIIPYFIIEKK